MEMFTRYDGDPQQYLGEMQCNWFELETGEAFLRTKNWGASLKKFVSIGKHFTDYVEDMFDFHGALNSGLTLRSLFVYFLLVLTPLTLSLCLP